jgi:riboflavin kinase/FMN adenylyltransferase
MISLPNISRFVQTFPSISQFPTLSHAVATTGTFDGVHAGHQAILKRLISAAKEHDGKSVLITFDPHPRRLIHPEYPLELLTTVEERAELLAELGLDYLIVQPFTHAFSKTESIDFVRQLLVEKIGVKRLVIGHDHRFGRNREGGFEHLKEFAPVYGFDVEEIPALDIEAMHVSSTQIRQALHAGEMDKATLALTRPYFVTGEVVKGRQIGRTIGFPTANIGGLHPDKLLPSQGVYAVRVDLLDHAASSATRGLPAVANYGQRPSIEAGLAVLEAHLLEGGQDLYGQRIRVHFIERLRGEYSFPNREALVAQIAKDAEEARRVL